MMCGKTLADSWRRKKVAQTCFTPRVLISLNNYIASEKAKGNCCNQLPITLPRQKPNQANKARAGSQQQQKEVCKGAPGPASCLPKGRLKAAGSLVAPKAMPWTSLAVVSATLRLLRAHISLLSVIISTMVKASKKIRT